MTTIIHDTIESTDESFVSAVSDEAVSRGYEIDHYQDEDNHILVIFTIEEG